MNLEAEAVRAHSPFKESSCRKLGSVDYLVSVDTRAISACFMLVGMTPSGDSGTQGTVQSGR